METNVPSPSAFEHVFPFILLDFEEPHSTLREFIVVVVKFVMVGPFERVGLLQHFYLQSRNMITARG